REHARGDATVPSASTDAPSPSPVEEPAPLDAFVDDAAPGLDSDAGSDARFWGKRLASHVLRVATDSRDNIVVAGVLDPAGARADFDLELKTQGLFLAKYDPAGRLLFAHVFAAHPVFFSATTVGLALRAGDDILFGGPFVGSVDLGGGPLAAGGSVNTFVARFDEAGHHLWSRAFAGGSFVEISAVAFDSAGNALLSGALVGTT